MKCNIGLWTVIKTFWGESLKVHGGNNYAAVNPFIKNSLHSIHAQTSQKMNKVFN